MADKILLKRSFTTGSVPSTSTLDVGELAINVPDGTVYLQQSGSVQAIRPLLTLNTQASGNIFLTGSVTVTGNLSSSNLTATTFTGTASKALNADAADSVTFTTFSNTSYFFPQNVRVDGILTAQQIQTEYITSSIIYESGSTKFGDSADDTHQFTGSLSVLGTLSGSIVLPVGTVSSSVQIDYNQIQNKLSGTVSSSTQVKPLLPDGTVSSSAQYPGLVTASSQIDYNQIQNKLNGTISSSTQFNSLTNTSASYALTSSFAQLAFNAISASWAPSTEGAPATWNSVTNKPEGLVSSSTQFNSLTLPFTGSFTGSLTGTATTAATASFVNTLNQNVTATGDITAGNNLRSNFSSGDEGGEINLARPQTNTSISGSVVIDVNGNRVRIFESNSPNRGGYYDITALASGVGTNLAGGAGTVTQVNTGDGLSGGPITGTGTITLDTSSTHFKTGTVNALPVGTVSSSAQYPGWVTASSQIDYNNITNKLSGTVSSSTQIKPLLPDGTLSSSAQYPGWVTASSQIDYNQIQNKLSGVISGSQQFTSLTAPFTGSFTGSFKGLVTQSNIDANEVVVRDYLELYPTSVTISPDVNSAYFYISGSNNDLWYTHKTDSTINFEWIEGVLETGLLYGGIAGFSGSNVYIRQGSGIIVNHAATTASAPEPTINYVNWNNITASIDVTQGYVTYLAINASGLVDSSSTKFTSFDYHDKIPLGAVGHFNNTAIAVKGEQVNTQYSAFAQLTDFTRTFGPIKVGGFGITPQSGSLKFTRAAGDSFIYGGFYSQNPETPSNFQSTAVNTGSLAYIYRTGSAVGYAIDANNNNFYTDVKPGFYDVGGQVGTASLASNEWSIQRIFLEPVSGIHYIYYGQSKYTSLANAVSNILTDSFTEGPATSLFTVFIGYLIMKGDTTNLADTGSNNVLSAGLFRNTSAGSVGGGAAAQLLNDLSDVTVTSPVNGDALIYNSGIWQNGNPTSASYANNATTASAATSITFTPSTASFAITSSYVSATGLPSGIVSSSTQINYDLIQNKLNGTVSSSTQVKPLLPDGTVSSSAQYPGWVTASSQIDITVTSGYSTFSSSLSTVDANQQNQINSLINATSSYALQSQLNGVVSSSGQVKLLLPDGTVSSSAQYPGWVTASSQIDYNQIQNKLSGTISSSTQFNLLSNTSASYAFTASYAENAGASGLTTKAGSITNTTFAGNPRKVAVNFSTPFINTNYAVVITGEDARSWTIEGKVVGGFTASANSNTGLTGTTYWIATAYGET